ncbi:hypothetical protein A4X09_0g5729 [Tilletia walkeri]|uniref:VASt domain-containing protein n=1 Tax=Tilletia walkeri TaxID=117179 RepID=A0A8X7N6V3_9BASI|nr:hypothetical protein A4X09_0g5729 [Tilletia walkeri]
MPILANIVKARRNSRQPSESAGDGSVSSHTTTSSTPAPNRHELMRRAMQTSTFDQDEHLSDADHMSSTPAKYNNNVLPPGSLLSPGSAMSGATQKAQQTAMRSPSRSAQGTPNPEAAQSAAGQGPPGVLQHGLDGEHHDRPGDGSLTFDILNLGSAGDASVIHAEPHLQSASSQNTRSPSAVKQRPGTAPDHSASVALLSPGAPVVMSPGSFYDGGGASTSKSAPGGLLAPPGNPKDTNSPNKLMKSNNSSVTSLGSPSKAPAGSPSKARQLLSKKSSNGSHGIAGALAASAMTGMGVGMTSPQNTLLAPTTTPKRPGFSRTASGSNLSGHAHTRDQSSATFIDHGTGSDNEDAVFAHEHHRSHSARRPVKRQDYGNHGADYDQDDMSSDDEAHARYRRGGRSAGGLTAGEHTHSSSASNDGSYLSELSSSSVGAGLDAAAGFDASAAAQALLAPLSALASMTVGNNVPDYSNSSGLAPPGGNGTASGQPSLLNSNNRRVSSEVTATQGSSNGDTIRKQGQPTDNNTDNSFVSGLAAAFEAAIGNNMAGTDPNRTPGTPLPQPILTPNGIGALGGLSPSGMGERLTLDDPTSGRRQDEEAAGAHGRSVGAAATTTNDNHGQPTTTTTATNDQYSNMGLPPLVTGFAVASTKRNNAFHQLFSNVPEDDFLIEDYSCALAREILVQGRVYVSENHLAFNANIFGWVTNVVIPFTDIVSIEKRMTAFVIPNAIQISTLHAKHTFTSFLSRDTAYDLIANIWRISHPNFTSNFDAMPDFSDEESVHESEKGAAAGDESQDQRKGSAKKRLKEKLQKGGKGSTRPQAGGDNTAEKDGEVAASTGDGAGSASGAAAAGSGSGSKSTKKAAHRPTTCACEKNKEHYATVVLDNKYPAVPEKMYNLLFTSGFMKDFWQTNQKLMDLQMSDWSPDPSSNHMLTRSMSYIKPLTGSFGPKQAKCLIKDENLHVDFDDYVSTLTSTRTPDVPNGGIFVVKTRTCFSWAGGNTTKIFVSCTVEWSGRSMIKGIIDKASIDGQRSYYKDLDAAIHAYLKEHASEFKEEGDELIEDGESVDEGIKAENASGEKGDSKADSGAEAKAEDAGGAGARGAGTGDAAAGGMFSPYLDMVTGAVSDGLGMAMDAISGASPSMLVLGAVVVVLLLSNMWALTIREPPAGYRNDGVSYPRGGGGGVRAGGYGHVPAGGGGVAAGSGGDGSSDALAAALREVLREHFGNAPATPGAGVGTGREAVMADQRQVEVQEQASKVGGKGKGKKGQVSVGDQVDEIQKLMALINDAESKIAKLKDDLPLAAAAGRS